MSGSYKYTRAVMGGTFDRLHDAHRLLLRTAAEMAEEMFVGVVTDELGEKLFADKEFNTMIQSYEVRSQAVIEYVDQFSSKVEIGPLYDPWGPAPSDPRADVIVVSYETEKSAWRINDMRKEKGLDPLDVIVIPWLYEDGELLSSTRLRRQEANSKKHLEEKN